MKLLLLMSALVFFALPSFATTYAVTDSASAFTARTSARFGDVIQYSSGTYSSSWFLPDSGGRPSACVRIVGDVANPSNVIINGAVTLSRSYLNVRGFSIFGRLSITSQIGDSVAFCLVDSGGVRLEGAKSGDPDTSDYGGHVINDVTVHTKSTADEEAMQIRDMKECSFTRLRIFCIRKNAGDHTRGRYMFYSRRNTFTDCRLDIDPAEALTVGEYALGMRDDTNYNVFLRDTLWIGLNFHRGWTALLSQTGNPGHQTEGNQWYSCDYRNYDTPFTAEDSLGMKNYYLSGNVFAVHSDLALDLSKGAVGSTFRQNTFYSDSKSAVIIGVLPSGCVFSGNVFVARPNRRWGSQSDIGQVLRFSPSPASFGSDSNFFASSVLCKIASDSNWPARPLHTAQCSYSGTNYGSIAGWSESSGNDRFSSVGLFSTDLFRDARWSSLNLRPASRSAILSTSAPNRIYYGALAP